MATPILGLDPIPEASPLAHILANYAVRVLEAFADRQLVSLTLTAPPGSPAEGACYFVAASPTGAWAGQASKIACYIDGAWTFWSVKTGHRYYVQSVTADKYWNGSAWA